MSWSICFIGSPESIVGAMQKESENKNITGQSKIEYNAALPYLVGLVRENFNTNPDVKVALKITASGYGYAQDGKDIYRTCSVTIESAGNLV